MSIRHCRNTIDKAVVQLGLSKRTIRTAIYAGVLVAEKAHANEWRLEDLDGITKETLWSVPVRGRWREPLMKRSPGIVA